MKVSTRLPIAAETLFGSGLLWPRLHVVGYHEPPPVQLLVYVGDDPIDFPARAVFHLRLSTLDADFPRKVAIHVNVVVHQGNRSLRE